MTRLPFISVIRYSGREMNVSDALVARVNKALMLLRSASVRLMATTELNRFCSMATPPVRAY